MESSTMDRRGRSTSDIYEFARTQILRGEIVWNFWNSSEGVFERIPLQNVMENGLIQSAWQVQWTPNENEIFVGC